MSEKHTPRPKEGDLRVEKQTKGPGNFWEVKVTFWLRDKPPEGAQPETAEQIEHLAVSLFCGLLMRNQPSIGVEGITIEDFDVTGVSSEQAA